MAPPMQVASSYKTFPLRISTKSYFICQNDFISFKLTLRLQRSGKSLNGKSFPEAWPVCRHGRKISILTRKLLAMVCLEKQDKKNH